LAFVACANDFILGLGFEAKGIGGGTIWSWMVLEVAGFEAGGVVTVLGGEGAREMSSVLLLEPEEDRKGREGALPFPLCFWLVTRGKVTSLASGVSTAISILGEGVGIGTGP